MASSKAQISEINEKAIPFNKKKVMKFGLGAFQGKVLFLNIILCLNFSVSVKRPVYSPPLR